MQSDRVKLTKCDKIEWGEKYDYASDIIFNGPMFNLSFYCHILLYWEKVTSYEKFSHNRPFEVQIVSKIQRFNAIDGNIEMLKNVEFPKTPIKMKNWKLFTRPKQWATL